MGCYVARTHAPGSVMEPVLVGSLVALAWGVGVGCALLRQRDQVRARRWRLWWEAMLEGGQHVEAIPGQLDLFLDDEPPAGGAHPDEPSDLTRAPAVLDVDFTMRTVTVAWWGFSLDHDESAARASFVKRFGVAPAELHHAPGCLLVGPLPGRVGP